MKGRPWARTRSSHAGARASIAAGPVDSSQRQLPGNGTDAEDMPLSALRPGTRGRRRIRAAGAGRDARRGCGSFLISAQEAQPPLSLQAAEKRPAPLDGRHDVGVAGVGEGPSPLPTKTAKAPPKPPDLAPGRAAP